MPEEVQSAIGLKQICTERKQSGLGENPRNSDKTTSRTAQGLIAVPGVGGAVHVFHTEQNGTKSVQA